METTWLATLLLVLAFVAVLEPLLVYLAHRADKRAAIKRDR